MFVDYNSLLTSICSPMMCLKCRKCWLWKIRESFIFFFFREKIYHIYVRLPVAKCVSFWLFSVFLTVLYDHFYYFFVIKTGSILFLESQIRSHWYILHQRFRPIFLKQSHYFDYFKFSWGHDLVFTTSRTMLFQKNHIFNYSGSWTKEISFEVTDSRSEKKILFRMKTANKGSKTTNRGLKVVPI